MAKLDIGYVAELVRQAQEGDSNAFAELFAATCQSRYAFALEYLKDEFLAQEALQATYIEALRGITQLRNRELVLAWLNQLNLHACMRVQAAHNRAEGIDFDPEAQELTIENIKTNVRQLLTLPFSQSQALLLRYMCGMSIGKIARLTETRASAVRRCIADGRKYLEGLSTAGKGSK